MTSNTQIHDRSLSWLGTDTSIKRRTNNGIAKEKRGKDKQWPTKHLTETHED